MSQLPGLRGLSAFTFNGQLYSKEGGILNLSDLKVDSNTGRIIDTANGDSRDITDTLTSDEQTVVFQMSPSYQFGSVVQTDVHGVQPYQWILIGGAVLLTMLLVVRRSPRKDQS